MAYKTLFVTQESFLDRMFERVAGAGTQLKYENIVYSPEDRFRLQVLPSVWIARLNKRSVIAAPCRCKERVSLTGRTTGIWFTLHCRRAAAALSTSS